MSGDLMSDPGQQRPPFGGASPGLDPRLLLDKAHDPVQFLEVEASVAPYLLHGTPPHREAALVILRLVPDADDECLRVTLHQSTLWKSKMLAILASIIRKDRIRSVVETA